MSPCTYFYLAPVVFALFAYFGRGWLAWVAASMFVFGGWFKTLAEPSDLFTYTAAAVATVALIFLLPPLRRSLVSGWVMRMLAKTMPTISETEAIALNAGTVWWEADLFSGKPRWKKLLDFKVKKPTAAEQKYVNGPVEELCKILDDEKIAQDREMSKKAWDHIKKHKMLGLIIPKKYGGLQFSAAGQSAVVTKIASKSLAAAITVMVPNSLGPGELLAHYGTDEQKKRYLKNLASGKDIPCFALTEPHAGSDAANGRSVGVVKKGKWKGKEVLGISLTFKKRYITLAPIATVVGLAFRLTDPKGLLGGEIDVGITCALLPRDTKGLKIGDHHDPCGVAFPNGTVEGKEVFIPIEYVIGGEKGLGNGWRMLMEQLSAGRGISLPSLSLGGAQISARAAGAYAQVRQQFGLPIGKFEGVREPLSRLALNAYYMTAANRLTLGAIDAGERPSVASAIAKAYMTAGMRESVNDAMDIFGGAAICRGPRNIFARIYSSIPIGITVEGANILTRSLIVFGQGAIRCHPFVLKETEAIAKRDLKAFDAAFWGHINHITRNGVRAFVLAWTGARLTCVPGNGDTAKHLRRLNRLSAAYAFIADVALATLGGALKRKEYLSGRFADGLAWMYIASSIVKYDHDRGYPINEQALRNAVLVHACHQVEQSLQGVLANLPNRPAAWMCRLLAFPFGFKHQVLCDKETDSMVKSLLEDKSIRESLSHAIHIPGPKVDGLGKLEAALAAVQKAAPAYAKLMAARRRGKVKKALLPEMVKAAKAAKLVTEAEAKALLAADKLVDDVVQVDSFAPKVYKQLR